MNAQVTQLSLFETRSSNDPFAVRVSPRARRLTARVHVGGRVEIVVPVGVSAKVVRDFVQRFTPWIDRKVAAMQCHAEPVALVPQGVEFAFTNERFDVQWHSAPKRSVTLEGGRLVVHAPDDGGARHVLQGWLKRAAPEVVRYLFLHELAHTKHMNHSASFWRLVEKLEPEYRRLDRELLAGWRTVPAWVFRR